MKIRGSTKVHYDSGPNMTPLVDIVMVILIFLMLAGTFGAARQLTPWKQGGHAGTVTTAEQANVLNVFVSSISDETFRAHLDGGESFTDAASLRDALEAKRVAHETGGGSTQGMQIMINPRLATRYQHLTAVYEAAMAAKWPKVTFATARQ